MEVLHRSGGSRTSTRFFVGALILLVSIGLFGLGVLLSNSYGASQVADNARELHEVNANLGAAGIARASVAQAVFFSYEDVSDEEGSARAIAEARESLAGVAELASLDALEGSPALDDFIAAGNTTVDLAEAGESSEAETIRINSVEPAFDALEADLGERQVELATLIADSEETGGRISRLTFVAISFAIPAITMVAFWLILRRRVREREQLMQARLEAEQELSRAKDEFVAGLSHELRTPLTTIVGFSEILVEDPTLSADTREQLGIIHSSSADLARMVGDLLVAARLEADSLTVRAETVDLAHTVKVATATYVLSGEDIKIKVPATSVLADPLHLRQIIHNLVSNALRHGGDRIVITTSDDGDSATLMVADDGPGVPPDLELRLFQRFAHEGRQALLAGSVGLGLAVSQELARRMGGAVLYERSGSWTTFTLRLPSAQEDDPAMESPGIVMAVAPG
ncbi:MAG: HAMP domain-containing sensor histidine kinase [Acidimicrobiia bacterium]